jgi:hypothetical protein
MDRSSILLEARKDQTTKDVSRGQSVDSAVPNVENILVEFDPASVHYTDQQWDLL